MIERDEATWVAVADLAKVAPALRTEAQRRAIRAHVVEVFIQSRLIHPDWTPDQHVAYLINDDFTDPVDVASCGSTVDGLLTMAFWMAGNAKKRLS